MIEKVLVRSFMEDLLCYGVPSEHVNTSEYIRKTVLVEC